MSIQEATKHHPMLAPTFTRLLYPSQSDREEIILNSILCVLRVSRAYGLPEDEAYQLALEDANVKFQIDCSSLAKQAIKEHKELTNGIARGLR